MKIFSKYADFEQLTKEMSRYRKAICVVEKPLISLKFSVFVKISIEKGDRRQSENR